MDSERFGFNEGIQLALEKISIDAKDRQTFTSDAQIIQNEFIKAISRHDDAFKAAFQGLSLTGSYLDDVKIGIPDEFDMHVKINLPCLLLPVEVPAHPGFIYLRVLGNIPDHLGERRLGEQFISREKLQDWFRKNISAVITELQDIQCENRVYGLKYIAHGYGVAHTIMATERRDRGRKIYFDFVPVFQFESKEWPKGMPKKKCGKWFAVPRKFMGANSKDDSRSFMVCAPHWERMALHHKQNLKDSLRLLKAFRNANEMPRLVSYMLKSLYLNEVGNRKKFNWKTTPGIILIRMLAKLSKNLYSGNQPFYLVPEHNNFDSLSAEELHDYEHKALRGYQILANCREFNCLTLEQLNELFGV